MAKISTEIGFSNTVETAPGVWEQQITAKKYYAEVSKRIYRNQSANKVNDDIDVSNSISILADPFALENIGNIVYATFGGTKWKVNSIEAQFPRLILSIGGVFNE